MSKVIELVDAIEGKTLTKDNWEIEMKKKLKLCDKCREELFDWYRDMGMALVNDPFQICKHWRGLHE